MLASRLLSTLSIVIAGALSVSAAPVDLYSRAVQDHQIHTGAVFRADPVNFEPQHPGNSAHGGGTRHPVVALGPADHHGYVPVVSVSHNHPEHMSHNVQPASHYDHHTAKKFQHGSGMAIGNPVHVHKDDLHAVGHNSHLPQSLHHHDAEALAHDVYKHHYSHAVVPEIAGHAAAFHAHHEQQHRDTTHAQGHNAWNIYRGAHAAASAARGRGGHSG
ncbi:hypothetical protein CVT26_014967 [Gymnopilus dilepis]|uniref:Uncharacterized protein n=1 Tax=Gymnopilus dilepis TaxID=231916 RepID=A0A409YXQ0_9AGAR|nr:hypothetical protein CVT26_014967 [Gymnopilus dilepis]